MFIALFFQACATKVDAPPPQTIVFPPYPEEPKILYLDTYIGGVGKAVDEKSDFAKGIDLFLGEDSKKKVSGSKIIKPYGVGLQNGKLYVADTGSNVVFVIDEKSKELEFIGSGAVGTLSDPVSIAFDANGTTYVSNSRASTIQGYDEERKQKYVLGGRLEFAKATGIAINKKLNRLYVVDTKAHLFKAFDIATKKHLFSVGKRGVEDGEFNFPTNVAVDQRNGNVVIVDTQNFRVQIFDKEGKFITKFGKAGDKPGMFARPKGVGIDSDGNIYVADSGFNNVQIFSEYGKDLLLYFGGSGETQSRFNLITGVYIDESDKIAIADGYSGRVQTFQYISDKWKEKNPQKYKELKEFKPEL
jgi:YVTN family beta-propeller protein